MILYFIFLVSTCFWEIKDFSNCKFENTMLDTNGYVTLSSEFTTLWDNPEVYIWSILEINNNLYVGTGGGGKIYEIIPTKRELFDTKEAGVFSLCNDKNKIFAGTSGGKIFVIEKDSGKLLYETGQQYIWGMVYVDNNLYVATGVEGKIFKINKNKIDTFYSVPKMNVRFISYIDNYFYVGTGEGGLIYKIDKKGKGFCLYDAKEEEIIGIVKIDTLLYFGANVDTIGSVYKIYPNNTVEKVWSYKTPIRGIQKYGSDLLVASGSRLYKINKNGKASLIYEFLQQISCLYKHWIGTSEIGKLYKINKTLAKEGKITSIVYDTKGTSTWGNLEFIGDAGIKFRTRTGNSGLVDESWSTFEPLQSNKIKSPNARFIQWEAIFDKPLLLKEVKLSYLPQNERPIINEIQITKNKDKPDERKITWIATDINKDELIFNLYFKMREDKNWLPLKENTTDSSFVIDKKRLPDGEYEFKLIVSDELSNPKGIALKDEKILSYLLIDNTPPEIKIINPDAKSGRIEFECIDKLSIIKKCEYSIDCKDWKSVFPVDNLYDERIEKFYISVKDAHKIAIRVWDNEDNFSILSINLR